MTRIQMKVTRKYPGLFALIHYLLVNSLSKFVIQVEAFLLIYQLVHLFIYSYFIYHVVSTLESMFKIFFKEGSFKGLRRENIARKTK